MPAIWTTNNMRSIDPAFVRRFDYVLKMEVPPKKTRRRILDRHLGPDRICFTTDCMSAAGSGPGTYQLGRFAVEVGEDGIVRQPGKSNYAGSSLTPLEGVRRAAEMLDRPMAEVWGFFSDQPVRFMGLPPFLEPGAPADFCLLYESEGNRVESHFQE